MNHIRVMKHHIPSLILRRQPLPLSLSFVFEKLTGVLAQLAELAHVRVEGGETVSGAGEEGGTGGEGEFDGATEGGGRGEVDEAAAVEGDVACDGGGM